MTSFGQVQQIGQLFPSPEHPPSPACNRCNLTPSGLESVSSESVDVEDGTGAFDSIVREEFDFLPLHTIVVKRSYAVSTLVFNVSVGQKLQNLKSSNGFHGSNLILVKSLVFFEIAVSSFNVPSIRWLSAEA